MTLSGTLQFEAGAPAFSGADLILRLEDTSQADAPASPVVESMTHDVRWSGDPGENVKFTLEIPDHLPPGRRYELRAHVDTGRTKEVTRGDFITTQAYPIKTGEASEIPMQVKWLR